MFAVRSSFYPWEVIYLRIVCDDLAGLHSLDLSLGAVTVWEILILDKAISIHIVSRLKIEEFEFFNHLIIALEVLGLLELKVLRHVFPDSLDEIINSCIQWLESVICTLPLI